MAAHSSAMLTASPWDLLQRGGELFGQAGEGLGAAAGGAGPFADLFHHAADALGAVLEGAHRPPDRRDDMLPDDPQGRPHQEHAYDQGRGAGDEGNDIDPRKAAPGRFRLGADGGGEGVEALLRSAAGDGHIPVGDGVGRLGPAVGAGADQVDQGVLEGVVVLQQGAVDRAVLLGDKGLILRQLFVQRRLLRLDLLDQLDHRGMVRRHDVAERQPVDVHYGAPDVLQPGLADHILVYDGPRVSVDVVDADSRQDVGQQGNQSQKKDGHDKPLLQCKLAFHMFPPSKLRSPGGAR